jgi:hypothetical protein
MEAATINHHLISELSLKKMMAAFFKGNTPDSAREFFFKVFQCWVTRDCNIKAEISDEEVALFFDQLTDLVAAAYNLHQSGITPLNKQGGNNNE